MRYLRLASLLALLALLAAPTVSVPQIGPKLVGKKKEGEACTAPSDCEDKVVLTCIENAGGEKRCTKINPIPPNKKITDPTPKPGASNAKNTTKETPKPQVPNGNGAGGNKTAKAGGTGGSNKSAKKPTAAKKKRRRGRNVGIIVFVILAILAVIACIVFWRRRRAATPMPMAAAEQPGEYQF